ncbi:polysaccharide deacetylase family protein [Thiocystis violacea]|uniref:polysaccharide deacetylase family protein n=1 Tax=Thiocystis violacea TaxID=13725 RepID=UPI0019032881|nr:polysaccharide deacetylase family protein [Thiocystis violacea]MBK1723360.1 polysaccharide deacetylase family protein [Thiocystis violacea]
MAQCGASSQPANRAGCARPWRPSALIWLSLILHLVIALVWLWRPGLWPWWLAVLVANHLVLTLAGLWPRSTWLGPNWRGLPPCAARRGEIAITIDDGPDPSVTPAVLTILARHGVKATFFCIGVRAAAHPELVAEILSAGHAVENHSYGHRHDFSLFGPRRIRADLDRAQTLLTGLAGAPSRFFRAPAGLRNPFLEPVLARVGLQLVSWTRRGFDTRERDPLRVLARLEPGVRAGGILLLHDGNAARGSRGQAVILEVLPALIERIRAAGLKPVTLGEAFAEEGGA